MKITYLENWEGTATEKIEIVDETITGKYVLRRAPFEMTRPDGTKYMSGGGLLFLRDKSNIQKIYEEGKINGRTKRSRGFN